MQPSFRRLISSTYLPYATPRGNAGKAASDRVDVVSPANGEKFCSVMSATPEDVDSVIQNAHTSFLSGSWSRSPVQHRSKVLSNLARSLEGHVPRLAELESRQTGRTIREMRAQLARLPEWLDYFAAVIRTNQAFVAPTQGSLLNYVQRVPLGVVAQITPFNHPLLIAVKKIAPALAAGNSVVVKPSEAAPASVLEFAELATEAGVPDGILSVLPGRGQTIGKAIVSHPLVRKVDITAGTATGRDIGALVGANLAHYTAELGGKAPIVIFNDADIPAAVAGTAFACFIASGQTCVSGTRVLIQRDVYEEFLASFLHKVDNITQRIGNPLNPASSMGTLISSAATQRVDSMVKRTTGTVLIGGHRLEGASPLDGFDLSKGLFYAPTVIEEVSVEDELWRDEVFGPVVVVKSFETENGAVNLANDSKYGLGAGLWTSNLSRAHRVAERIESGLVWVNTHHRNDPSSPWGGMKESGIGRENGLEAFHAYTQSKSIIVNTADTRATTDDWFAEDNHPRRYG